MLVAASRQVGCKAAHDPEVVRVAQCAAETQPREVRDATDNVLWRFQSIYESPQAAEAPREQQLCVKLIGASLEVT
jgi:hypothetical protein